MAILKVKTGAVQTARPKPPMNALASRRSVLNYPAAKGHSIRVIPRPIAFKRETRFNVRVGRVSSVMVKRVHRGKPARPMNTKVACDSHARSGVHRPDTVCPRPIRKLPATETSDRVCTELSRCRVDEFERTAPSPTSDRICAELTICTAQQYESTPPTSGTDRVCTPLTVCTDNQFESRPATPTSDRMCAGITECRGNEFEVSAPATVRTEYASGCVNVSVKSTKAQPRPDLRPGMAITVCNENQYESAAPTAASDRRCSALTVCHEGQYESISPSANTDRVCSALTVCAGNQYEKTPPDATSDRVCTALTVCESTQYVSLPPTETTDRACAACHANCLTCSAAGERACESCRPDRFLNNGECMQVRACDANAQQTAAPTPTSNRECVCLTGYAGDGYVCEDINECETQQSPCHANAICTNTPGHVQCA